MKRDRPIDKLRNSAATIRVGGDDSSEIVGMLSTSDGLYVLRASSVHRVRLADEIDPDRTNISIPNVSQSVLDEGSNNDIVATILLTAKELFDQQNATVSDSTALLFDRCVDLTKKMLDLDKLASQISDEVSSKINLGTEEFTSVRSVHIPSCPPTRCERHCWESASRSGLIPPPRIQKLKILIRRLVVILNLRQIWKLVGMIS